MHVPAPGDAPAAPGRRPTPGPAAPGAGPAAPAAPARRAPSAQPRPQARVPVAPAGRNGAPSPDRPNARPGGRRRRFLPHRPRLRRILLLLPILLPLLLLLGAVVGWFYAQSIYDEVEKIPLGDVLSTGGAGTNYLIVGSDSRDVEDLVAAGLNPEAFEDGGGQRSDTMMLLRFVDGAARMMSIPRDLYVQIAETGESAKINAAYNGGPPRLIRTVQESLGIPVHHYLEVDFVSFAGLVDSLGGITIDFPNPAYDEATGLDVQAAGPVQLDGPQALAYVRSRHFVEVVGGEEHADPTGDLGRVQRQQRFLTAVFGKLGDSKNPLTLARAAEAASGGLRIDDQLGMTDAMRLAWRLRALDPAPIELPTRLGSNRSGSVLLLVEPDSEAVLAQFR